MFRTRRRSRRLPVLAGLVVAAAAIVAAVRAGRLPGALRRVPDSLQRVPESLQRLPGPLQRVPGLRGRQPGHEDWTCACGARYRVTGMDRHRVYWPAGADKAEPVLSGKCVNCERPLPTT